MSKRKLAPSPLGSKKRPSTGSSAERSEIQELHTFRGTPRFEDAILSAMFGVSSALGSISRAQEVLLDKIECIAAKVETLSREVQLMKAEIVVEETPLQDHSWLPSDQEIKEWLNSPIKSPEPSCSTDLTCYETPFPCKHQLIDLTSASDGSTDLPEWANLDLPMNSFLPPM